MEIVCLDLEGVLVPEIWVGVAEQTGINELRATTRDISDYDELMKQRLRIMGDHSLGLSAIRKVVNRLEPLNGAKEFLAWLNTKFQVLVLSDTFYEFSGPLMHQLNWPTLFCHRLETNEKGDIVDYHLRMNNHKLETVKALKALNFTVYAAGDSYNDTGMLEEADYSLLFRPPHHVLKEFPQFPVLHEYADLKQRLIDISPRLQN